MNETAMPKRYYKVKYVRKGREEDPGWHGWRIYVIISVK
jgi:hypothetical protein